MNLCKCKLRKEIIYKALKFYVPVYLLLFALVYGHVNCAGQGSTKSPLVLLLLSVFMLPVF